MLAPLAISAATLAAGAAWFLAPLATRVRDEHALRRRCRATGTLVLTYDDGPGPQLTPRLLELLAAEGARATFFVSGSRALDHPEVVDRLTRAGHEVGCHGHDHLNAWFTSPWRSSADLETAYGALARWLPPWGLYRPPFGKMTLATWAGLRRRRATLGWWTIVGGDVDDELPAPDTALERAARAGGGVVLLHDFDRGENRAEFVLESTRLLLDGARRLGWAVRTLGDLARSAAHDDPRHT